MNELDSFFSPRSIALVGASTDPAHLGGIVFDNLRSFRGELFPINPCHPDIHGMACYRSIRDLPGPVDLSVILLPAAEIPRLLKEHAGITRCAVIVSSGFAESGDEARQEEVARLGRELGIRIIGPNCLGVYNPYLNLDTFFLSHDRMRRPKKGNVALVSQSGALLVCLLESLALTGRGVSRGINYGNAVDIDAPDIYDYLADDPQTDVVVSYLESVGDGRRFVAAAQRLAGKKPLLLLKAGKGEGGQRAAYSHTGRLAGRYEVFSSIMRQAGIHETADFEELLDGVHALSEQRQGTGNRVCIVTNAGGLGVLAADECSRLGLPLPSLPDRIRQRLHERFPPYYSLANPLDLTGMVRDEDYPATLSEVCDAYDGFLVIAHTGVVGLSARLPDLLAQFRAGTGKPLVAHLAPGGITAQMEKGFEKAGIPVYPSPERGVRGLRALLKASPSVLG